MRVNLFAILVAATLLMAALTACNSTEGKSSAKVADASPTVPQATAPADDIHRISIADARAAFDSGKAVIIDVRGEPSYKAGHIKGARLIAFNEIGDKAGELPKDKNIILYCSCPAEHSSVAAAQVLKSKNITNTAALVGGYNAWKDAGYPIEAPTK